VNSAIRADLPEEARVQQLNDLQKELVDAGDMVTKQLEPDQILAHGLFVSVDKTQAKIKPTWPLPQLQDKCFEQYNALLRHKPNQPVQSAAPILTLLTMPITRLAFTLLSLATDQRVHLSFTPGTRVDEMYRAVFTDLEDERGWSDQEWYELDLEQADATHNYGDFVFIAYLLKEAMPEATALRRTLLGAIAAIEQHWRSLSLFTGQATDHWSSLPSGISWTYIENTMKVLRAVVRLFKAIRRTIMGGDDGAVAPETDVKPNWPATKTLGTIITLEAKRIGFFSFHASLHSPRLSTPDIYKLAMKLLDRRYVKRDQQLLKEVQEYQNSIKDQLRIFNMPDRYVEAIALTAAAHECTYELMEVAAHFALAYTQSDVTTILNLSQRREFKVLPTAHPGPWTGGHIALA